MRGGIQNIDLPLALSDVRDNIVKMAAQCRKDELIELKTGNDELIQRGIVGQYDGFDVKSTNNLYRDEGFVYCMVRSRNAIAFVGQVNQMEAGTMEKRFSDYIRGLDTYGAKIIAQDELVCVKIPL